LKAIKYIYKYISGFDCANIAIRSDGQQELRYNEIANYIDARYVSAPEAMWRLLESKMHDRSHAVHRLPVHLSNQQRITFEEGHEEEALLAAQTGRTKLRKTHDSISPYTFHTITSTYEQSGKRDEEEEEKLCRACTL
jgi:hypothetical protein